MPENAQKRYITPIPDGKHAAGEGRRAAWTRYLYERRAAGYLHGHVRRRAHIRIAAIRPKVAKVADSRKVDSRRIVGKSPESR